MQTAVETASEEQSRSLMAPALYAAFAILAAGAVVYSQTLAFHWDEGFHILTAYLIHLGKRPYLDFFFPQTPLNAYWNAVWLGIFGRQLAGSSCCGGPDNRRVRGVDRTVFVYPLSRPPLAAGSRLCRTGAFRPAFAGVGLRDDLAGLCALPVPGSRGFSGGSGGNGPAEAPG